MLDTVHAPRGIDRRARLALWSPTVHLYTDIFHARDELIAEAYVHYINLQFGENIEIFFAILYFVVIDIVS